MSFKKDVFFCLDCDNVFLSSEASQHPCHMPLRIIRASVTFEINRNRWERFLDWFLKNIGFVLAFTGATRINIILLPHFNLNIRESILESFCLGFVLVELFKDKK